MGFHQLPAVGMECLGLATHETQVDFTHSLDDPIPAGTLFQLVIAHLSLVVKGNGGPFPPRRQEENLGGAKASFDNSYS